MRNTARMRTITAWLLALATFAMPATGIAGSSGAPATGTPGRSRAPQSTRSLRPRIVWDPIPFGSKRRQEMVAYVRRHYGSFMRPTWRLIDPHVIVIHYTDSPTFQSAWNTFATDAPDSELHELPATCAHFVIDTNGEIHQLVGRSAGQEDVDETPREVSRHLVQVQEAP